MPRTRLQPPTEARLTDVAQGQLSQSVLRLIWQEGQISRAEIARRLGLSRSTVSDIVSSLLKSGLVTELGAGPSSGGRRPIALEFQDNNRVILGVEMGAAHVSAVLTDLRCRVLAWETRPHPVRTDPAGTRALIKKLCDACLAARGQGTDGLVGIGIAVPSPVHSGHPEDLPEVVLPAWKAHAGFQELAAFYKVPIMLDNDANLGALAEAWWGAGVGQEHLIYVKIGTGIGSGHIIHGEIYRGATGLAGEIGHVAIDLRGPDCVCGLNGCLVTFAGAPALVERADAYRKEYPNSALATREITIGSIEAAALAGDPLAVRVVAEAAEMLGIAFASVINVLNPSMVVIGGGLASLGDLLLRPLREIIHGRTLMHSLAPSAVRVSDMGPRCIAIGAATLVLKAALEDPRMIPPAAAVMEPVS